MARNLNLPIIALDGILMSVVQVEFEKRNDRRREALRLRKEERERNHNLQNVMDCITKIEGINKVDGDRKYGTLQPRRRNKPVVEQRTRSLSSAGEHESSVLADQSRKRTNTKRPEFRGSSCSDTGSFLDLLFSSDEEEIARPCRQFTRSTSDRESGRRRTSVDFEKRKLNRGFPSGEKQAKPTRTRTRMKSAESDSSDTMMISAPTRPTRRGFLSLKRSSSKGSTGSTASTCSNPISPAPKMEFERPNLFDQLRCEQQVDLDSNTVPRKVSGDTRSRFDRQQSAPVGRVKKLTPDNHVPNIKQSRSKDSIFSKYTQRPTKPKQFKDRSEHTVQVYRDHVTRDHVTRLSPEPHTPSSDGGYYSGKNLSPNDLVISNGHKSRTLPYNRSQSAKEPPRKVSPTFDILFDDVNETRSPSRVDKTSMRQPTPKVDSDDPLIMALAGNSRKARSSYPESNSTSLRKSPASLKEDTPVVVEPPRNARPMTEAQRRYERRFYKSPSPGRNFQEVDRDFMRELSPTPPYPAETLNNGAGYSLEMINPDLPTETWTSPRLDESVQEANSRHDSEVTVREVSELIDPELDLEIEGQLMELEQDLSDEESVERVAEGTGLISLSGNVEYSYCQPLLRNDMGV